VDFTAPLWEWMAMNELPDPVTYAIPGFIILLLAEMWFLRARGQIKGYEWRDTATSLLLGIGSQISGLITAGILYVIAKWVAQFAVFDIGFVWWAWPLCFVLDDLAYYAFHRSAHRVRWFWAAHVIHHSSQHYNLSTALRQTWTGFIALGFVFRLPLLFAGFPIEMLFFCGAINLIYQFWFHTEAIDKMPRWFEAIFNTPSHHRVHHATNARYLDSNYAGVFIVWDRMFGTFVAEDKTDQIEYGLVKNLGGFNLLWAAIHEWVGIAQDVWRAPMRHKISYMLREPGWSHDGSRETSAMIKARSRK
jgi:sterol desaturase/sphingolipid hydroxylase (fatty acid hydroxylase superfamily)